MSLADAMTDLIGEVRKGAQLDAAAAEIAPDYGFHPSLLVRKFNEAYPSGLPKVATPAEMEQLEKEIQKQNWRDLCAMIDVMAKKREEARIRKHLRTLCVSTKP